MAKQEASQRTGIPQEEIGAIFISPCPAKVTATKMPIGSQKSAVDGVIAVSDVYPKLFPLMNQIAAENQPLVSSHAGRIGISWGSSSGEASGLINDSYLAADGIENVIGVLEDLEDEKINGVDFIELNACSGGCVGGVLNVENPYIAETKLKRIRKTLPVSLNHPNLEGLQDLLEWDTPLEFLPVMELDSNMLAAMEKMARIEEITSQLEGLDCGSCGAPSCRALAEDVVRGMASVEDCVFYYRSKLQPPELCGKAKEGYIPPPFRAEREQSDEGAGHEKGEA